MPVVREETTLSQYTASHFEIVSVELTVYLAAQQTRVINQMAIKRTGEGHSLVLQGEQLQLQAIKMNDQLLDQTVYRVTTDALTIVDVPESFSLTIETLIDPSNNHALMGLYQSNDLLCTQCEAEGFRRITYYLDRPDVLSVFTTKLIANKQQYPVLLSNGNLVDQGDLPEGQHFTVWHDPHKKPCYLFALVAGQLSHLSGRFITTSGREVTLAIYSEPENIEQCHHAMQSIKKAMQWDEENYGREYDLDVFNIVAVNDFNFGAMENKGLNIFNAKYILANPQLATDNDYQLIDTVVAHEYFHNWSGNRVTLRDWFQLSLKEGLTVFREQSFDETVQSAVVHRIESVTLLRDKQFSEDAGPNAHPIRPDSYLKIDNFYTHTIYDKGSEVIRMLALLLGKAGFRQAADRYFEQFDGMAVTTDDFLSVMEDVSGFNLDLFRRWYVQSGTPVVDVVSDYDAESARFTLTFKQHTLPTPKQAEKQPLLIPIRLGLIDGDGQALPLDQLSLHQGDVFLLDAEEKSLVVDGVREAPTPSLLRHFSAPIQLNYAYTEQALMHLVQYDTDGFSRWEAMQRLALSELFHLMIRIQENQPLSVSHDFVSVFRRLVTENIHDKSYHALLLTLPSEAYIASQLDEVDIDVIHLAREGLMLLLAQQCATELKQLFSASHDTSAYQFTIEAVGLRKLKNVTLSYLVIAEPDSGQVLAMNQFKGALGACMTDCLAALSCLSHLDSLDRIAALEAFQATYGEHDLAMNKWLSVQAMAKLPDCLASVKRLLNHECFDHANPNSVYALLLAFTNNRVYFHALDGLGYQFIAEQVILLDTVNPMVAARLVEPLTQWRTHISRRQELMQQQLRRIIDTKGLSENVYELVHNSLAICEKNEERA